MKLGSLLMMIFALACGGARAAPQFLGNLLVQLARENLAGLPVVHNKQSWPFHPDEGLARRARYEQLYGPRAQWLIKALGEGEGGFPKLQEGEPYRGQNKA